MKIVVLDGYAVNPGDLSWEPLKELGEVEIYESTPEEKIMERAKDADIILTNKIEFTAERISQLPDLKYIGVQATGYNIVDLGAAAENDIVVSNVPAYSTDAVAQFVFALTLEVAHHVGEHNRVVKAGKWSESEHFCFWDYPLIELKGKTMGIIGYGNIGQRTAEIALAFGLKVIVYDRSPAKKIAAEEIMTDKIEFLELEELYQQADIISLHCPLTDQTEGMINKNSISQMKPGVIIINTARGGLIIEEDLKSALEEGKVFGAAVDVLSTEPPKKDNPLLDSDKTIITPHIAWASKESRQRLVDIVVENVKSFINGQAINQVN
ncbi:D-2-hydroxyacid dehydrogenase [Halanaerobium hydrogeniformans]|uniref:D-isomer specific 2-hydroxyacid dehydrogenase NAD-binding protein n=1 Tax=Halanaerobium hydrogeniformans TaxID=656519 RepID=E4RJT5_HALHG|nr:D-2-hydroxyacid dehydrogenase [Halanaerobium hydrogeniformans]ADQ15505.1 D-isomer specific 2-hydroxyacid dehydrogenase NAD-binding protein [Halanaerobium hydrogeniformans]